MYLTWILRNKKAYSRRQSDGKGEKDLGEVKKQVFVWLVVFAQRYERVQCVQKIIGDSEEMEVECLEIEMDNEVMK